MGELIAVAGITEKQRRFVSFLLAGKTVKDSALSAGYSENDLDSACIRLMQNPNVIAVLRDLTQKSLVLCASSAVNVLTTLMNSESTHPRIRLECAKTVLDRAGVNAPKNIESGSIKGLSEMTGEELSRAISRLHSEIGARMEGAKVIEGVSAPIDDHIAPEWADLLE